MLRSPIVRVTAHEQIMKISQKVCIPSEAKILRLDKLFIFVIMNTFHRKLQTVQKMPDY